MNQPGVLSSDFKETAVLAKCGIVFAEFVDSSNTFLLDCTQKTRRVISSLLKRVPEYEIELERKKLETKLSNFFAANEYVDSIENEEFLSEYVRPISFDNIRGDKEKERGQLDNFFKLAKGGRVSLDILTSLIREWYDCEYLVKYKTNFSSESEKELIKLLVDKIIDEDFNLDNGVVDVDSYYKYMDLQENNEDLILRYKTNIAVSIAKAIISYSLNEKLAYRGIAIVIDEVVKLRVSELQTKLVA